MKGTTNKDMLLYRHGEPCEHPGCAAHISHPCEVCNRIAMQGNKYKPGWIPFSEFTGVPHEQ